MVRKKSFDAFKIEYEKVKPEHQSIYDVNAYKTYLRKLENSDKIVEAFIQFLEQRSVLRFLLKHH